MMETAELETETRVEIVREPLTYRRDTPRSYFRDLALAHNGNNRAAGRLEQHTREMDVELPRREQRAQRAADEQGIELRVNPNVTAGTGGNFAPPLWLIDEFATAPRPGRVLAHMIPSFQLPPGVASVNLPRLTTGTQALPVIPDGTPASRDIIDAQASSPVVTIAGRGDVALQLLEQSPPGAHLDWAIFKDLTLSYDHNLELELLNGSGTGAHFFGLLNLTGINNVTYTDATPTGSEVFPFLGQMAAQIGDARLLPPEVWLMRTARWSWLGVAEDTAGQPLAVPGHVPTPPMAHLLDDNTPTSVGTMLGWPIYPTDSIPATFGVNGNQDAVLACRPSDMILLESAPQTSVNLEVLSGTLQARLQLHAYAAAITGRYPTGVAALNGTGLIVQSGF